MAKKNLSLTLDLKMTIWGDIVDRNEFLQKKLEALRSECSKDPDWDPIHGCSKRFAEVSNRLLVDTYGFEFPSPCPVLETTVNNPEIIYHEDGAAKELKSNDPPVIRTVSVDLRYTREEIHARFHQWLDSVWSTHESVRMPTKQQVAKFNEYLRVYDLRGERKTFRVIAAYLEPSVAADNHKWDRAEEKAKKNYRRALGLIYGRHVAELFFQPCTEEIAQKTQQDTEIITCNSCQERESCTELCPSVIKLLPPEVKRQDAMFFTRGTPI